MKYSRSSMEWFAQIGAYTNYLTSFQAYANSLFVFMQTVFINSIFSCREVLNQLWYKQMAVNDNEMIVLLDEMTLEPIGSAPKLQSHHDKTPLHRAFSCWVFDTNDRLLITKRAHSKKVWPGVWTNSFCGHPAPEETFESAIMRRAQYELGITRLDNLRVVLPEYRYVTPPFNEVIENEFCPVYFARLVEFSGKKVNSDEVESYDYIDIEALGKNIGHKPEEYSYWFKDQLNILRKNKII